MDTYLDNGAPIQKTINPLIKWFDGVEKKNKSSFKESDSEILRTDEHRIIMTRAIAVAFACTGSGCDRGYLDSKLLKRLFDYFSMKFNPAPCLRPSSAL